MSDTASGRHGTRRRRWQGSGLAVVIAVTAIAAAACGGHATRSQTDNSELTACMRAHGIHSFPTATSNGQFNLNGVDQSSPRYQAAWNECGQLFRSQDQAQQTEEALAQGVRYAQCMRAHGIPSFPDPTVSGSTVSGQVSSGGGSGINLLSPQGTKARQACRHVLAGTP
jgi:hypothetical protein